MRTGAARRLLRTPQFVVGAVLVLALTLTALVGPLIAPHGPTEIVGAPLSPPGDGMLFGTDAIGRDVLSRVLHGGVLLLVLSVVSTALGTVLGTAAGLLSAWRRGSTDLVLMRGADVLLAFPQLVLAMLLVAALGPEPWLLALAVGLSNAPRTARVVRAASLDVMSRDYVLASRAYAQPTPRLLSRQVLPNVLGPLMAESGLRFTYSIGIIASLSFLGLGVQPPQADWGVMINENRIGLAGQPLSVIVPVVAIGLLAIGANQVTDAITQVFSGKAVARDAG